MRPVLVTFALAMLAGRSRAQDIRGLVLDGALQTPIAGAEVIVDGGVASTRTSEAGTFALRLSTPAPHIVTIRQPGYRSLTTEAPVSSEPVEYALDRVPRLLEEVVVLESAVDPLAGGKLRDFYERRRFGIGTFLQRGVFEDARSLRTTEILSRHVAGIRIVASPCGLQGFVATPRSGGGLSRGRGPSVCGRVLSGAICLVNVMLDGIMVYNGSPDQAPFDVNSVQPGEISAIEYYRGPSQVPAALNATSGGCGLIGIWTR